MEDMTEDFIEDFKDELVSRGVKDPTRFYTILFSLYCSLDTLQAVNSEIESLNT
jgi:hypothetical protein